MNDLTQTDQTIIIDGKVSLDDYKIYWRDIFFRDLPNTFIFWGTLAGGGLLAAILFRDSLLSLIFLLMSFLAVAIPVLMLVFGYRNFMTATQKYIASLSDAERHYNIIIKPDGKGMEFMQGENFTFISWKSIRNAIEREQYFSLEYKTTPFLIMKHEFTDEADIALFRVTLADRFGSKARLLQ